MAIRMITARQGAAPVTVRPPNGLKTVRPPPNGKKHCRA